MTPAPMSLAPRFLTTPMDIARSLIVHRTILRQLVRRDILSRYRKSALGMVWALLTPLLTFAVYAYVFSAILKVRFPSRVTDVEHNYGIILFSGLILHFFITEILTRSPVLVLENVNFVKKVVFPLELLSVVATGSAAVTLAFNFIVLIGALFVFEGSVSPTALLIPLVWLPFFAIVVGVSWVMASLGVYLRDIGHIVGILSTVLLFGSPILFPPETLPETLQTLIWFNPLSVPVHATRDLVLWGVMPNWEHLGIYSAVALVFLWLGAFWFQRTKKGFADVL